MDAMKVKRIAIVTGATGGLGREFIRLLLKEKNVDEIWALARNEKRLGRLTEKFGKKVKIYSIDLSSVRQIQCFEEELKQEAQRRKLEISYLINNAGFAKFCSYGDLSIEESLNMIHVNIDAVVAMGLVCIPYMKKGSHLINIASQASFQPLPYQNIYSSTKSFVRNYSRALNVELKEKGIYVTAVCPGWIKTDLYKRAEIGARKATTRYVGMVTPDKVAKKTLKDAKKGKDISIYSLFTKISHVAAKLLPQRIMMKIWLKQQHLDN